MDFQSLFLKLLCAGLNGQGVSVTPSLAHLDFSGSSILRIDNLSIQIGTGPDAPRPRVATEGALSTRERPFVVKDVEVRAARTRVNPVLSHYRIEPHLVFDHLSGDQGEKELEIAPRVKAVVFGNVKCVDFHSFNSTGTRQRVHFDSENRERPVAMGRTTKVCFDSNQRLVLEQPRKRHWSFRRFPLAKATSISCENDDGAHGSVLVTVDEGVYENAWLLTQRDWRPGFYSQRFLLLRERTKG